MSDERDLRLGELLNEAVRAIDANDPAALEAALATAGADRDEVVDMVEAFLTLRGPRTPAAAEVDELAASAAFAVRAWPDILADARHAGGLQRSTLVARLADQLGIAGVASRERLRIRYHELEAGLIDPRGVSATLTTALGALLGGITEVLEITRSVPAGPELPSVAFQRTNEPELLGELRKEPAAMTDDDHSVDEVDRLFGVDN
jgi:hypothetical protein